MADYMNDIERVEELKRYTELTWNGLARKLGLKSAQTFTDIRAGRHGISAALRDKILTAYPEISETWIVTGIGPMFRGKTGTTPLYGSLQSIGSRPESTIDAGSLFPNADAAIRYQGGAMSNFPSPCILILKRVINQSMLVTGEDYVIETTEFTILRRLQEIDETLGVMKLYPTSADKYSDGANIYGVMRVPIEGVQRIFSVLGYIVSNDMHIFPTIHNEDTNAD